MTYDTWKTTEPDDTLRPTKEWLVTEIAELEKDIAWNERRLVTLVLDDDDRQLTEDLVTDLRQKRQRLLAVLNG